MSSEVAFAELYRTHYRRVFGLCRKLLGKALYAPQGHIIGLVRLATAQLIIKDYWSLVR